MIVSHVVDGACPIYTEVHGNADVPSIVMIPGLGMRISEWPPDLLHRLSRSFHLICIENRDAGLSGRCGPDIDTTVVEMLASPSQPRAVPYTLFDMRDDVVRSVDALGIDRFAVVGFSMGGMIAQLVAANAGDRVTGLAQICSSAGEADIPSPPGAWHRFLRTARPFDAEHELVDWLAEDLAWWSAPTPLTETDARKAARGMIEGGFSSGGYGRQLLAMSSSGDRKSALKSIEAPALVIGGAQDRCILPESSRRAHALIANSQLVICESMGHALDPKALCQLEGWLKKSLNPQTEIAATPAGWRT